MFVPFISSSSCPRSFSLTLLYLLIDVEENMKIVSQTILSHRHSLLLGIEQFSKKLIVTQVIRIVATAYLPLSEFHMFGKCSSMGMTYQDFIFPMI